AGELFLRVVLADELPGRAAAAVVAVVPGEGKAVMPGREGPHHVDVLLPGGPAVVAATAPADERQIPWMAGDELGPVDVIVVARPAVGHHHRGIAVEPALESDGG